MSLDDGDLRSKVIHRRSSRADGSSQGCTSHDGITSYIGYFFPCGNKMPAKVLKEEGMVCFGFVVWEASR